MKGRKRRRRREEEGEARLEGRRKERVNRREYHEGLDFVKCIYLSWQNLHIGNVFYSLR